MSSQEDNRFQNDPSNNIWVKIAIIENKLLEIQKTNDKYDIILKDVKNSLDSLKQDFFALTNTSNNSNSDCEKRLDEIDEQLSAVVSEMPELKLSKKIVLSLVGFILLAVAGVIFNSSITPFKKLPPGDVTETAKKIIQQYEDKK